MIRRRTLWMWIGAGAVLSSLAPSAKADPVVDWFGPAWFQSGRAMTTYTPPFRGHVLGWAPRYSAPVWGAPVTPPATSAPPVRGPAPTCYYVPITRYRIEYRLAPAVACQAVPCVDPCTGCVRVDYRPVMTWAYRPQLTPYTTYLATYSAVSAAAPQNLPAASPAPAVLGGQGCMGCSAGGVATGSSPGNLALPSPTMPSQQGVGQPALLSPPPRSMPESVGGMPGSFGVTPGSPPPSLPSTISPPNPPSSVGGSPGRPGVDGGSSDRATLPWGGSNGPSGVQQQKVSPAIEPSRPAPPPQELSPPTLPERRASLRPSSHLT